MSGMHEVAATLGAEVDLVRKENAQLRDALRLADVALRQWQRNYSEWAHQNGFAERYFDWRLPPSEHLRALEAIAESLKGRG